MHIGGGGTQIVPECRGAPVFGENFPGFFYQHPLSSLRFGVPHSFGNCIELFSLESCVFEE